MVGFLDHYSRNARLTPAFIVAIPVSITLAAFGSSISGAVASLVGTTSALGLTSLLAQLGRDKGKRKEPVLFKMWGGKPSVSKLRHTNSSINPHTRSRYIEKATILLPELQWPTFQDELENPTGADHKYDALSNLLLERTRDSKKYPLVYAELVSYGFRRNLWGLKAIGLTCSIVSLAAILLKIIYNLHSNEAISATAVAVAAIDAIVVLIWSVWITPDWVRITANAYADRLLSSVERM